MTQILTKKIQNIVPDEDDPGCFRVTIQKPTYGEYTFALEGNDAVYFQDDCFYYVRGKDSIDETNRPVVLMFAKGTVVEDIQRTVMDLDAITKSNKLGGQRLINSDIPNWVVVCEWNGVPLKYDDRSRTTIEALALFLQIIKALNTYPKIKINKNIVDRILIDNRTLTILTPYSQQQCRDVTNADLCDLLYYLLSGQMRLRDEHYKSLYDPGVGDLLHALNTKGKPSNLTELATVVVAVINRYTRLHKQNVQQKLSSLNLPEGYTLVLNSRIYRCNKDVKIVTITKDSNDKEYTVIVNLVKDYSYDIREHLYNMTLHDVFEIFKPTLNQTLCLFKPMMNDSMFCPSSNMSEYIVDVTTQDYSNVDVLYVGDDDNKTRIGCTIMLIKMLKMTDEYCNNPTFVPNVEKIKTCSDLVDLVDAALLHTASEGMWDRRQADKINSI